VRSHLLIIPAFNESQRLPEYLEALLPTIDSSSLSVSVQVVDDGSDPGERDFLIPVFDAHQERYPFFLPPLMLEANVGKGGALYTAWRCQTGYDTLGFVDADGSIPATEVLRLLEYADRDPQIAWIGSRIKMLGKSVTRSAKRHYLGRVFATLVGTFLDLPVYDSQCGLKFLPASAFHSCRAHLEEKRFAFDVELLLVLHQSGVVIVEVPIDWHDVTGSKVHLLRDGLQMIRTVFRLRRQYPPDS